MTDLWVNDAPIENFLCAVTSLGNWHAMASINFPMVTIPGAFGQIPNATGAGATPRQLPIGLYFTPATFTARKAALATLLAQCSGTVRVRAADAPTRFVEAILTGSGGAIYGPDFVNAAADLQINFVSGNGIAWERDATVVSIPTGIDTDVSGALGTVTVRGLLQLTGVSGSAVVTVKDRTGATLMTLTLTGTLAAGEYLILNGYTQTISRVTGASVVDAFSWKGSTDKFPVFDPIDGPQINLSGGAVGQFFARKGYPA